MNFKIGDSVVVSHPRDCIHGWNSDMVDLKGKLATITGIGWNSYSIDLDHGSWMWCDKSLEPVEDCTPIPDIDIVTLL